MNFKVLDTFAGAGGFSLGFQMAGAEIVGAIEKDEWACETFQYNHPNTKVLNRDITSLSNDEIILKTISQILSLEVRRAKFFLFAIKTTETQKTLEILYLKIL